MRARRRREAPVAEESKLPRDEFSIEMRKLSNDPGAVRRQSVVEHADFYGNLVTWIITTFRTDGEETVLLQRQTSDGGDRLVLPPKVMAVLTRHRDGAITVGRRRRGVEAAAKRKAAGLRPAFLRDKK